MDGASVRGLVAPPRTVANAAYRSVAVGETEGEGTGIGTPLRLHAASGSISLIVFKTHACLKNRVSGSPLVITGNGLTYAMISRLCAGIRLPSRNDDF